MHKSNEKLIIFKKQREKAIRTLPVMKDG